MALQHLRSSTADKRPTPGAMSDGQLAINTNAASTGLFFKDSAGALVKVGPVHVGTTAPNASPAVGGQSGNTVGEQWLDTSGGTYVFKVWDGSAWRSETGTFVDVNGDTMTGALGIIAGSESSPGLFVSGDTNTGIYSPGADQLAISTGGTQRINIEADGDINIDSGGVFYDATNNRLAVGTTSPGATLEVNGDTGLVVHPTTASTAGQIQVAGTRSTGAAAVAVVNLKAIPENPAGDSDASSFAIETRAYGGTVSEKARIDSSGRLLVGTSSVFGAVTSSFSKFQIQGNTFSSSGTGIVAIRSGTAGASISSGAYVGQLVFSGADNTDFARIDCAADGATGSNDYPSRLVFSTTSSGSSSPTERMRITNTGELRIGTTSSSTSRLFVVAASSASAARIQVSANGTGAIDWHNAAGGYVASVIVNASSVSYNTTSDYRLKENVTAVTDGITRLQQLKPSRFNFIADPDKTVDGFLAHEVQDIVPEAISGEKDAVDDEGNPQYQGIDQSKLVPLLTAALQEAIGEIESLKARVAALEAN